jgi:alkylhydroperoxidase/carboxymuconolactone decarboxylase family protein YurZ
MSEEKKLVEGLYPKEGKVDFVKCQLSIKKDQFTNWYKKELENKDEEWINIDVLVSKGGKWYCAKNTFKPKPNAQAEGNDAEEMPDF